MIKAFKKILLIPYFGSFNCLFDFWFESAKNNPDFDFIVFTDANVEKYSAPNIRFVKMSFKEIKEKIQSCFDFKISLEEPYKLCDYKTAYCDIFSDYIKDYDYWGYCDIDLVFGKLSNFYSDTLLAQFDKISDAGHFTLYKNNEKINSLYKRHTLSHCFDHKTVFSNSKSYAFDEWGDNKGINRIIVDSGYKLFFKPIFFADIRIDKYSLITTRTKYGNKNEILEEKNKKNIVYSYKNGHLFQHYLKDRKTIGCHEESYVHFQKRPMIKKNDFDIQDGFVFCPPNLIEKYPIRGITIQYLKTIRNCFFYKRYYIIRFKNMIRRIKGAFKND